jgi:hypothetical protein
VPLPRRIYELRRLPAALLALATLTAAQPEAPKAREAAVLARVLSYELTLDERAGEAVGIAVVYKPGNAASEANAESWYQALAALGSTRIKGRRFFALKIPHEPRALAAAIDKDGVDVLLASSGLDADLAALASFARARHILSAADSPEYLKNDLTVCVTQEGDKPKIYINLKNADLEHIRFSSNLLRLTTLVR